MSGSLKAREEVILSAANTIQRQAVLGLHQEGWSVIGSSGNKIIVFKDKTKNAVMKDGRICTCS